MEHFCYFLFMSKTHTKQIIVKIPPFVGFYRDAEAAAIQVKRDHLDRVTLLSAAASRLRQGKQTTAPSPGPKTAA